jgi:hypothetical protein
VKISHVLALSTLQDAGPWSDPQLPLGGQLRFKYKGLMDHPLKGANKQAQSIEGGGRPRRDDGVKNQQMVEIFYLIWYICLVSWETNLFLAHSMKRQVIQGRMLGHL